MQVIHFLLRPRVRWWLSWLLFLAAAGVIAEQAWTGFNDASRYDGNGGHATIDFGGQWIMGRMIVEGQGRHLYHRNYIWPLTLHSYPAGVEDPKAEKPDSAWLMDWLAGRDDPEATKVTASLLAPLAAGSPLDETVALAAAQTTWTKEQLEHVTTPHVGGALYPPIHALYYAPLGLLRPPVAYRFVQVFIFFLLFFDGWMIHRMTEGRVWWPIASLFLGMFPGYTGSLSLGQNGMFTFTLVLLGWWQLMRGREAMAGLCWGLLAFKPVWAVAFFLVPLLTARWRMAVSMAATGIVQILMTLPIVGLESWLNWLDIGRQAAQEYKRQQNWIFLSRDLLGIPRRWLLSYQGDLAKDVIWRQGATTTIDNGGTANPWDHPLLSILGWGLWATVLAVTLLVAWRCRQRRKELTGLFPTFVLSAAVLTCFHFMYYDSVAAGLAVLLLFTEPSRYLQIRFWKRTHRQNDSEPQPSENGARPSTLLRYYQPTLVDLTPPPMPLLPGGRQPRWVIAQAPPLLLCLMLVLPAIGVMSDPSYRFPPWETFVLLALWAWCGYRLWRSVNHRVTENTEKITEKERENPFEAQKA